MTFVLTTPRDFWDYPTVSRKWSDVWFSKLRNKKNSSSIITSLPVHTPVFHPHPHSLNISNLCICTASLVVLQSSYCTDLESLTGKIKWSLKVRDYHFMLQVKLLTQMPKMVREIYVQIRQNVKDIFSDSW